MQMRVAPEARFPILGHLLHSIGKRVDVKVRQAEALKVCGQCLCAATTQLLLWPARGFGAAGPAPQQLSTHCAPAHAPTHCPWPPLRLGQVGVRDLVARGKLRAVLRPLINELPVVGAVKLCFVEAPVFSYQVGWADGLVCWLGGWAGSRWLGGFLSHTRRV